MRARRQLTQDQIHRIRNFKPTDKGLRFPKKKLIEMGFPEEGGGLVRIDGQIYAFVNSKDIPKKTHLIGIGGYGKIKLLQNIEDPSDLKGVKVLGAKGKPKVTSEAKKAFVQELEMNAASNRGSVHLIEKVDGKKDASICGVIDLAQGISLKQCFRENFSAETRLKIALGCFMEIQKLHYDHIIHADLNQKNFIYDPETGTVKVVDLGLAERFQDSKFSKPHNTIAGTYGYIDPESVPKIDKGKLLQPGKRHPKNDVYALGKLLQQLFGIDYKYRAAVNGKLETFTQYGKEPSKRAFESLTNEEKTALNQLIAKMTDLDLENRYSLEEALADLTNILSNCSIREVKKPDEIKYLNTEIYRKVVNHFTRLFGVFYNQNTGNYKPPVIFAAGQPAGTVVMHCINQEVAERIGNALRLGGIGKRMQQDIVFNPEEFQQLQLMNPSKINLLIRISGKYNSLSNQAKKRVLQQAAIALVTGNIGGLMNATTHPENKGWESGRKHETSDLVKAVIAMLQKSGPQLTPLVEGSLFSPSDSPAQQTVTSSPTSSPPSPTPRKSSETKT